MRVAMVSEHASPLAVLGGVDAGGQNVHVAALASAMARRGVDVTVYTRRENPHSPSQVQLAPGVTVQHVPAGPETEIPKDELLPYMDAFADRLHRAWTDRRPDVVHAHFWMSGRASVAAAKPLGVPVVQTFHALGVVKRRHQGERDTSPPERIDTERALVRTVDHVLATCTDEVFELTRLGAHPHSTSIVPCGVDLATFTPHGPTEPRPPHGTPKDRTSGGPVFHRLVVVSRLVERKGIGNVICALPDLPGTELVVAGGPDRSELGSDPTAQRLVELASSNGVRDRVDLRGRVERASLPALLRSADAVVCVPWYEPFGIVPLEAMACGVPVVASAVGGLIDTVVDGVTGLHVPPRSPERVAAAIRRLLSDARLRASLGRAGAARARSRYSWDRIAGSTLDLYGNVLEASPAPFQGVARWRA
jgi:D-inositol-3-phosphate glycosyltransferase